MYTTVAQMEWNLTRGFESGELHGTEPHCANPLVLRFLRKQEKGVKTGTFGWFKNQVNFL